MAPFTTQCTHCGAKFNITNPKMQGKKTKCKKCGQPLVLKPIDTAAGEEGSLTDEIKSLKPVASRRQSHVSKKMTSIEKKKKETDTQKVKKVKGPKQKADKKALVISLVSTLVLVLAALAGAAIYYMMPDSASSPEDQDETAVEAQP